MKKSFIALMAFLGMSAQLYADVIEGKCGDNVIYKWNTDNGNLVISGNGPMDDYDYIDQRPWHGPSPSNFTSIVIEHGVTHIGDRAFSGFYGFGGVLDLPSSVTSIGDEAFSGCSYLTQLVLSPLVVTIGDRAFNSCWSLEGKLVLPDCLETIGDGAFNGCKKLSGDLVIPNSVKSIGNSAFSGCAELTGRLLLGSSLETIGEYAFSALNFTGNLVIPESVTSIGRSAFEGCKLLVGEVDVPEGVTTIESTVFRDCSGITGVTLRGQVTHIRNSAFNRCSALKNFVCYATTPPDASEYYVFDNIPLQTVYVPAESVELYKSAWVWKNFEILPIPGSGIEGAWVDEKVRCAVWGNRLMVSSNDECLRQIALVGVNGVEVLSCEVNSSSADLDIASLPSGIYLVKVLTSAGEYCQKIAR